MTSVDDMMASAEGTGRQQSAEVKERKMSFEEVKKLPPLLPPEAPPPPCSGASSEASACENETFHSLNV